MPWHSLGSGLLDPPDDIAFGIWRREDIDPHTSSRVRNVTQVERRIDPAHVNALKRECPRGHPYDEANTYVRPDRGSRSCRACRKESRKR
jgi:hypothetical protein